jgi:hypothetical protein
MNNPTRHASKEKLDTKFWMLVLYEIIPINALNATVFAAEYQLAFLSRPPSPVYASSRRADISYRRKRTTGMYSGSCKTHWRAAQRKAGKSLQMQPIT